MDDLHDVRSHCPTCGAEYRAGFETCADDDTPLVPGPAPLQVEEPDPTPSWTGSPGPPWEPVAELRSEEQAHLLAGRLRSEGIEAFLDPPQQMAYYGVRPVRILVPPHRVLEAADVIRRLSEEDPEAEGQDDAATVTTGAGASLTDDDLDTLLHEEAGEPRWWRNEPGETYSWHDHRFHKILFCVEGSIVFHTRAGDIPLEEGDRLDLPPGMEHGATVGPGGVTCVEAAR